MKIYNRYKFAYDDFTKLPDEVFHQVESKLRQHETGNIDVSVVVIAFNEEKRILPCICSLADQQTKYSFEIIVVNNASTDHTQSILDKVGVKSVFQPLKGVGNARQAGLDIARGTFLFTADADTIYPPMYIDTMMNYLAKPGVSAVFTHCKFLPDGNKSRLSLSLYEVFRDIAVRFRAINRPELAAGGASMAFNTEYGRQIGFRTHVRRGEDGAMILGLKEYGSVKLVKNKRAYVYTTSRTLDGDGNFFRVIMLRVFREFKRINVYFTRQKEYIDQDYNLMK